MQTSWHGNSCRIIATYPPVTREFNAQRRCYISYQPQKAVEQTVELSIIQNTVIWRHCFVEPFQHTWEGSDCRSSPLGIRGWGGSWHPLPHSWGTHNSTGYAGQPGTAPEKRHPALTCPRLLWWEVRDISIVNIRWYTLSDYCNSIQTHVLRHTSLHDIQDVAKYRIIWDADDQSHQEKGFPPERGPGVRLIKID